MANSSESPVFGPETPPLTPEEENSSLFEDIGYDSDKLLDHEGKGIVIGKGLSNRRRRSSAGSNISNHSFQSFILDLNYSLFDEDEEKFGKTLSFYKGDVSFIGKTKEQIPNMKLIEFKKIDKNIECKYIFNLKYINRSLKTQFQKLRKLIENFVNDKATEDDIKTFDITYVISNNDYQKLCEKIIKKDINYDNLMIFQLIE